MVHVVTAAGSQVASSLCRELLSMNYPVRAVVRDPDKDSSKRLRAAGAEVRSGDYHDVKSLQNNLQDAESLFVLMPPFFEYNEMEVAEEISRNIVEAVRESEVQRVVALSSIGSDLSEGTGSIRATYIMERILETLDCQLVFVRGSYFLENMEPIVVVATTSNRLISFISPVDHMMSQVSAVDVGKISAKYMACDVEKKDTVVEALGPRKTSTKDIADILSQYLNVSITADCVPDEQLEARAQECLGLADTSNFVEMTRAMNSGKLKTHLPGSIVEVGQRTAEDVLKQCLSELNHS